MPTILRQDEFEIMIYTNDHPPMHVHVFKAEGETIINLGDEQTPPSLRETIGMSRKQERRALEIVGERQVYLLGEWRRLHG